MITQKVVILAGVTTLLAGSGLWFAVPAVSKYDSTVAAKYIPLPVLDKVDYHARLLALAHVSSSTLASLPAGTTTTRVATTTPHLWPVKTIYPNVKAILPFKRIVAYYGNFYSTKMGVLGEYPPGEVMAKLTSAAAMWAAADPTTPVLPAIQYIATVAQDTAGKEGKYILRMPDDQIDKALDMANQMHGILILDVQVAQSTLQHELPMLDKYLALPNVELAIDPEFSMKHGDRPGTVIGTFDAADINYAAQYLANIVKENHIPPKVLVVHRFTGNMVTNYKQIQPLPDVEIVMDMDGWGSQAKKKNTYLRVITSAPVQFTGIKLFYHADLKAPSTGLLTTKEVLDLMPAPIYVQYQ